MKYLCALLLSLSTLFAHSVKINECFTPYQSGILKNFYTEGSKISVAIEPGEHLFIIENPSEKKAVAKTLYALRSWKKGDPVHFVLTDKGQITPLSNRRLNQILFAYAESVPANTASLSRKELFIAGERCSGTNFLGTLIKRNFYPQLIQIQETQKPYNKHFHPWNYLGKDLKQQASVDDAVAAFPNIPQTISSKNSCMLLVVRDPYDWIRSLDRLRWHAIDEMEALPFPQYIRSPWLTFMGEMDQDPFTGKYFENVLKLRAAKILLMLQRCAHHRDSLVCSYELATKNPELVIAHVANMLGIPCNTLFSRVYDHKGLMNETFAPRSYFTFTQDDLDFINANLAPELEELFGFKIIEKTENIPSNALL